MGDLVRAGMWVEFVGLPGAGKSSVTRILAELLAASGCECLASPTFALVARGPITRKAWRGIPALVDGLWAVRFVPRNWRLWRHLRPALTQPHFGPRWWRFMRISAALSRLEARRHSGRPGPTLLLDQGALQCLRSLYPKTIEREAEETLTRRGIEAIRPLLPDLVVLLCVDEVTAAARMRARPFQRTSFDLEDPALESALEPHRRYTEQILPAALDGIGVQVIRLDGTLPPEVNARRILEAMSREDPLRGQDQPDRGAGEDQCP